MYVYIEKTLVLVSSVEGNATICIHLQKGINYIGNVFNYPPLVIADDIKNTCTGGAQKVINKI